MQLIKQVGAAVLTFGLVAGASAETKPAAPQGAQLELFGVKLKGATRSQLRAALKAGGMRATRIDDSYWADTYDATGVLDGASEFSAGYVAKTGSFAYAQYQFKGFMDTGLVTKVARMVAQKYGRPTSQSGDESLGPVKYRWAFPQGMAVTVSRGWPDTTTYLTFSDQAALEELKAEQAAEERAQERAKAKAQTNAF